MFQYTHFSSSHLLSVKKGFIKRETLRLLRTNLVNEIFELQKLEFLTHWLKWGYPRELAVKHFSQSTILIMKQGSTKQSKNIDKYFAFHHDIGTL